MTVFSFDTVDQANDWAFIDGTSLGTAGYPPPPNTLDPTWNNEDGCPDAGQLRFTIPFDSHAGLEDDAGQAHPQGVRFTFDYGGGGPDWTNRSVLHVRLKVEQAAGLEFLYPFIDVAGLGFRSNDNASSDYTAANLGVGVWSDLTVPFPHDAGSAVPSDIGFEIYATQPGVLIFDIDSIWVE
jgi:hypothetical protein